MEVTGKIFEIGNVEKGVSQNGTPWFRRVLVIQTMEDYPKTIAMTLFGEERCKQLNNVQLGQTINAKISLNSRKYEGRWFSEISCIGIGVFQSVGNTQQQQYQVQQTVPPAQVPPQVLNNPAVQQLQQGFGGDFVGEDNDAF
ncbi:MAG: DUF3127 domain-containing protein [Bacteroidales bacterium]|nr:DUF3127 domain-containing protein [Bacteroidales bacterium]